MDAGDAMERGERAPLLPEVRAEESLSLALMPRARSESLSVSIVHASSSSLKWSEYASASVNGIHGARKYSSIFRKKKEKEKK
jgi:hypothetical protein